MQPSVFVAVLSHLSAESTRLPKDKTPNRQNFSSMSCPTVGASEGMYLDLIFLGGPGFSRQCQKRASHSLVSDRLLVGSMPVQRDAIYAAELIAGFLFSIYLYQLLS